jgi:hypothetical protein
MRGTERSLWEWGVLRIVKRRRRGFRITTTGFNSLNRKTRRLMMSFRPESRRQTPLDTIREFIHDHLPHSRGPYEGTFDDEDENGFEVGVMTPWRTIRLLYFPVGARARFAMMVPMATGEPVHQESAVSSRKPVLVCAGTKAADISTLGLENRAVRHCDDGV